MKKVLILLTAILAMAVIYQGLNLRPVNAVDVNLALNKTATASSTDDATNRPAGKAVDGNATTRWSSAYSDPQWIYVDLGSTQTINHVKLNWEVAYGSSYKIQVSNDASTWTDAYSTTTGDGGIDDFTFTAASGRYVRMYGTVRATQYGYSLYEFEIYNSSATSTPTPTPTSTPTPATTPTPGAVVKVDLTSSFNRDGFSYDTNRANGDYDGHAGTYSADLINTSPSYDGATYQLGPKTDGSNNVVKGTGQTITLAQGQYTSIRILASGVNNDQAGTFRINYSDATYSDISVTVKDWCASSTTGEKVVQTMAQRHISTGDQTITCYVFAYYLVPSAGKTVSSLGIPNNNNINVLAISMISGSVTPTPSPTATPSSGPNLALNRAAYHSSSQNYDNTGHMATDGSTATRWESQYSDPQWIYIDLGTTCQVNRVVLNWESAYGKAYKIQVSNDSGTPANWTDVYSTTTGDGNYDDISFTATSARYVRMYGTQRSGTFGYSLWEFEVYGTGGLTITAAPTPTPCADGTQYLSGGNWKLQRAAFVTGTGAQISQSGFNDSSWILATVPGTVLTSYLNIGAIPDPNFGDQQLQISDSFFTADFWYRNSFVVPSGYSGKKVWLNFDGINWKADIYVNGTNVGRIDGAFIRGKFDITANVTVGATNYLAVYIYKNANPGAVTVQNLSSAGGNGGILGADNPTSHASIGWDWVPTIRGRNIGIQNDVYLTSTKDVSILDPFIITDLPLPNTAPADLTIKVNLKNNSASATSGVLKGTINPGNITFSQNVSLAGSENKAVSVDKTTFSQLSIASPQLWWPNGYGAQNMYSLDLSFEIGGVVSDSKNVPFGIREMSYDTTNSTLTIMVNGKRIFCKGGNWGMDESMLRLDKEGYDIRVRLHKEENFTMIRNWVGMTGDEEFYNACDKYGILIWDDFWLANPADGPIPNDNTMFMNNANDKIKRFRNHPALALYCGRNEGDPPSALATNLQNATVTLDGTRTYISSSADYVVSGRGPYSVQNPKWYFQNRYGLKIHSEMGMPNVPPVESMKAMLPASNLWPINDMWGLHDYCNSAQNGSSFTSAVNNGYGTATGIDDFCKKAQMVDLENHKAMFEPYAGAKGNGLLLWMSQSAWPSTVWQTYDFYFETNGGYFGCKKACEPLHILWDCNTEKIRVTNTTLTSYTNLTAELKIYNMDGTEKYTNSIQVSPAADSALDCFTISYPTGLTATHFLKLKLKNGSTVLADNFYWRGTTYQNYTTLSSMNQVTLSGTATKVVNGTTNTVTATITNSSANVALMIRLKMLRSTSGVRVLPTYFEDNYFSLLPGESKQVKIEFDSKYLGGENPKLMVEGWNIVSSQITIQ
jgi:hypothetical protein